MAEPRIIDPRTNKPFSMKDIQGEPQTSRVGSLHQEFANHPTRGLTPPRLASILQAAEQGDMLAQNDLFDDMEEKDAHIFAEMQKRKLALSGLSWDIVPPRNASKQEEKAAALAKEILLDQENFEDVILDMTSAIGHGYSCQEMEWERLGKEWLPKDITFRPQRWFTVDNETRTELRLRNSSGNGDPLQPFTWIEHRHKSRSGYITRSGLHRVLAWPFLFKNYSVRDLAEFLEIYGLPLRLGTYQSGADDREKATLMNAVVNIGHAAAGIIPEGMKIEFIEAAKGAADPFEAMMGWAERSQSKAILGGTLTSGTGDGTSTNALGNVHNEVRHDLLVADANQVAGTLTRDLVYPIIALNSGGINGLRRCPRFVYDTVEPEDLKLYSEAMPKLVGMGMRIPVSHAHEKLRIPEAEDGEEILGAAKPPTKTKPEPLKAIVALKAEGEKKDVADHYAEQLDEQSGEHLDTLIEPVRQLVMESETLEEIRDGLEKMYTDMDEQSLTKLLQQALGAAMLAGRFEINEGK